MIEISVVIATAGRATLLRRCLEALENQSLAPGRYEIIVVDDAPPHAAEVVPCFAGITHCQYLQTQGRQGPATARNRGWKAAQGRVIAFTDDDTIPDRDWLNAGLAAFTPDVIAASGRTIVPLPEVPTDYQRNESNLQRAEFITANCFVLRDVLLSIGGFDERFRLAWREDSELHFRLLDEAARSRRSIVKAEGAIVTHPVRDAPWGISLRQQHKSLYNALLYRLHPHHYRSRIQSAPPWHYYAIVLSCMAAAFLGLTYGAAGWIPAFAAGLLILRFCYRRLQGTSRHPAHIAEMAMTSAAIPFLAVFYRCLGALRFRVPFL